MDPVEIMLEEYKTLRQESLNAMSNRNIILSFGLASISAVFTGSIIAHASTSDIHSSILILRFAFILVIPAISCIVLLMWLGEYERMQRAGKFLAKLELKINTEASRELLSWEKYLRERKLHMKYPYYATVVLLTGISGISLVLGWAVSGLSATWMLVAIAVLLLVLHLDVFMMYRISKLSQ